MVRPAAVLKNGQLVFTLANGHHIPALGFGTYSQEAEGSIPVGQLVKDAIRAGYRHIDCAPVYANEAEVGKALQEVFQEGTVKREDLFITTKLWNDAKRKADVKPAFLQSLRDLQLDYVDLFLIHWPVSTKREGAYPNKTSPLDPVPVFETWAALEQLVEEKLVRSIGVSNFNAQLLSDLLSYARIKPQVNQVELHPLLSQEALVQYSEANGVLISAYAPLGGQSEKGTAVPEIDTIKKIAHHHKKTPAQVLLRWAVQRGTNPLPKTSKKARLAENFDIFDFALSEDDVKEISALNRNERFNQAGSYWPPLFA